MTRLFVKTFYPPAFIDRFCLAEWRGSITAVFAILFPILLPVTGFQAVAQSINPAPSATPSCLAWPSRGSRNASVSAAARIKPGDNFSYILYNDYLDLVSGIVDPPTYSASESQQADSPTDGIKRKSSGDRGNLLKVSPDGTVFIPKVGFIYVAGLTIPQLEAVLRQSFRKIYAQPMLTISEYQPTAIYAKIIGQVLIPGTYSLPFIQSIDTSSESTGQSLVGQSIGRSQNNQRPLTLAALIVKSGGMLNTADLSRIEINRSEGSCFFVNLSSDQQAWLSNSIILKDGDTIYVNRASQVNPESRAFQEAARSDLASVKQRVYVLGEVKKPGLVNATWTTTPLEAIALAGGLEEVANSSAVLVTREPRSNRLNVQKISLSPDPLGALVIPDGSVMIVGRSRIKSLLRALEAGIAPAALTIGASLLVR